MSENTLLEARKAKFHYVREHVSPYPERYARTHELCEAAKLPDGVQNVCVAGRMTAIRRMGKLSFVTLSDMEGKLQIHLGLMLMAQALVPCRMQFCLPS